METIGSSATVAPGSRTLMGHPGGRQYRQPLAGLLEVGGGGAAGREQRLLDDFLEQLAGAVTPSSSSSRRARRARAIASSRSLPCTISLASIES